MTSKAPGKCCNTGFKHDGKPQGEWSTLGGVDVYLAYPPNRSTEHAILYLTDGFGCRFPNAPLMADTFAAQGYFVVLPDLFDGDPISPGLISQEIDFDVEGWLRRHSTEAIDPIVQKCLDAMRLQFGFRRIGAVGYCIGAKYVTRFLRPDQGKIDVGFFAHPTLVEAVELKAITGPLSIAAAETDEQFPQENRQESEAILRSVRQPYQLTLYGGVAHGFAVRGDPQNRIVQFAMEQALRQAVAWFDEFLVLERE